MGEKKTEPDDAEAKPEAKSEDGSSRRRRVVLTALGVALLTGAGVLAHRFLPRWIASREMSRRGASLHRCLFGTPRMPDETPDQRLRKILLTAAGLPAPERVSPKGPGWPGRCTTYAEALAEIAKRAGKPELALPEDLGARVIAKARAMFEPADFPLDALWEMAAKDGGPIEVPLPPAPATAPNLNAPNLSERIAFVDLSSDPVPGETLRLVFRGERGGPPTICALPKGLGSARCAPLAPRARVPRPALWPAAGDEGPALVTDRSAARSTFYRADNGQTFGEAFQVLGGFSAANELVGVVEMEIGPRGEERALHLDRYEGAQSLPRIQLVPAPRVRFASVFALGDTLAWIEPRAGKQHLFLRRLGQKKGPPGPVEDAGVLPHDAVELSACRAGEDVVIFARRGGSTWITRRGARGGSPLLRADEPPRPRDAVVVSETLACDDASASATSVLRIGAAYELRHVRCAASGCEISRVTEDELFRDRDPMSHIAKTSGQESPFIASAIGDAVVVAWTTNDAGVRARIARPDALASAADLVVYDEASQDVNAGRELHGMRLFPRGRAALLLLHTPGGIKALRLDVDGRAEVIRGEP